MKNEIKEKVLIISPVGNMVSEKGHTYVMDLLKKNFEAGTKSLLFNLGEVKVVNSTGLAMLLTSVSKTSDAGGKMALCSLPAAMQKLLKITKLESTFSVFTDERNAISYLKTS